MNITPLLNELVDKLQMQDHYLDDSDVECLRKIIEKHVSKKINDLRDQITTLEYENKNLENPDSYYFTDSDEICLFNSPLDLNNFDDYPYDHIFEFMGIKHISRVYVTGVQITSDNDFEWQVFDTYDAAKKVSEGNN